MIFQRRVLAKEGKNRKKNHRKSYTNSILIVWYQLLGIPFFFPNMFDWNSPYEILFDLFYFS